MDDRPGHDLRYAVSSTKARNALDWEPQIAFDTGLAETVQWFLEHEAWVERVTRDAYDGSRLGTERN